MSLHFFGIPALYLGAAQTELNRFCQAQRVVAGLDWALGVHGATGYNRPMSQAERIKELLGWLKIVFAALVAIDVSLIAWLAQNFRTADAVLVVSTVIAVTCITAGIVGVNHTAFSPHCTVGGPLMVWAVVTALVIFIGGMLVVAYEATTAGEK